MSCWNLLMYLPMQSLWYIISFTQAFPVSFRNKILIWIPSLLKFAALNNLSAASEDSIRNLFASPWHLTWLEMTHNLSQGSGDVIVLDLFWSGNQRFQWWQIEFFRLSFRSFNFMSSSFLLVCSVAGFDVIS